MNCEFIAVMHGDEYFFIPDCNKLKAGMNTRDLQKILPSLYSPVILYVGNHVRVPVSQQREFINQAVG